MIVWYTNFNETYFLTGEHPRRDNIKTTSTAESAMA